jgi:hypothetical protein
MKTKRKTKRRTGEPENPAPEGRPRLAQRFSAGKARRRDSSPGGTTQFRRFTVHLPEAVRPHPEARR